MKIPNEINLNEAAETAKYFEEYCNIKRFDVVHFFNKMADLERRLNMSIQIMKFADHKRMNAEEDLERERDEMADQLKEGVMKYHVKTIHDDYDCEDCGASYAEGFEIYRDGELVHTMKPVAHCLGGEFYTTEDWAVWIIRDLGGEIWIDGCEAAIDEATVVKGGSDEL